MKTLLIFIYVIASISLIGLILLQQSKGSDIGTAFGGGSSNTMFGANIMPENLTSEANALDTEMQSGLMWVVVVAVDNSKETMNNIGRTGANNYGDLILTSANMSRMGPFMKCKLENLCDAVEETTEILVLQGKQ